ncbi:MAG: hypothetical protein C9356_12100 [Oleiphilus sp.]|nr:MAG: hypothetical protein C9356_12100 [Oleiphilus sp.]
MLNKAEISFAVSIVNSGVRVKKRGVLSDRLHREWGIGTSVLKRNQYTYNHRDVEIIQSRLEQAGITLGQDISFGGSRSDIAAQMVSEKVGADPVFAQPMCMKVIAPGVSINAMNVVPTGTGHLQYDLSDIKEIRAEAMVIVENLETFKRLDDVKFNFPVEGYLFIWRGGPKSKLSLPNTQPIVKQLGTTHHVPTGFFGDYDLKGLIMADELGGAFCILPSLDELLNAQLQGNAKDYQNQWEEFCAKRSMLAKNVPLEPYIAFLLDKRQSYTQERTTVAELCHTRIDLES